MTIHYLDGKPFETVRGGTGGSKYECQIVAYDSGNNHFLAVLNREAIGLAPEYFSPAVWVLASDLDPPPPIPAAARKPQIGEVWMHRDGEPRFLFSPDADIAGAWYVMRSNATHGWCDGYKLTRPATPEEAEPFRPILEGLNRSLGEA